MVEQFKSLPSSRKDIVFIGNSIVFWGNWRELTGNINVKNRGIPGDQTYGVLARADEVIDAMPAKVLIMIGINDLGGGVSDSVILANWERLVKSIIAKSPRTKIFIQSILPTNPSFARLKHLYGHEKRIISINLSLADLANKYPNCAYVDLYHPFLDNEGFLKKEYTWDGVHLTPVAYRHWLNILRKQRAL